METGIALERFPWCRPWCQKVTAVVHNVRNPRELPSSRCQRGTARLAAKKTSGLCVFTKQAAESRPSLRSAPDAGTSFSRRSRARGVIASRRSKTNARFLPSEEESRIVGTGQAGKEKPFRIKFQANQTPQPLQGIGVRQRNQNGKGKPIIPGGAVGGLVTLKRQVLRLSAAIVSRFTRTVHF